MPSRCREHEVETVAGRWVPSLEGALDHSDLRKAGQVVPGGGGQVPTDLHVRNPIAPTRERRVAFPVAQATSQPVPWLKSGHLDQRVEGLIRVLGLSLLIQVGARQVGPAATPTGAAGRRLLPASSRRAPAVRSDAGVMVRRPRVIEKARLLKGPPMRNCITITSAAIALLVAAAAASAATVPAGDGWGIMNRNTIGAADATLRTGPGIPPFGAGSLNLSVATGSDKIAYGDEVDFAGLRIADLTALGFSVLTTGENFAINPTNLPNISLEVDPNVTTANYSSLVYNPAAVAPNVWSTIDATRGAGWYFTNGPTAAATGCGQAAGQRFCTLDEVKTAAPDAVVTLSLAIAKGRDYAWHGAVDGLVVNHTTYDFEERAGATGPAGPAGAPGVTTLVRVPAPATAASGAAQATACRGDELRVLRAPRRKGEKFLSVRATLRGKHLKVDGRRVTVDLRHQLEGNYNVRLTTRHRKANGSVRTVKTTRNLSVVCS
jgi:hypothetical protein